MLEVRKNPKRTQLTYSSSVRNSTKGGNSTSSTSDGAVAKKDHDTMADLDDAYTDKTIPTKNGKKGATTTGTSTSSSLSSAPQPASSALAPAPAAEPEPAPKSTTTTNSESNTSSSS